MHSAAKLGHHIVNRLSAADSLMAVNYKSIGDPAKGAEKGQEVCEGFSKNAHISPRVLDRQSKEHRLRPKSPTRGDLPG